MIWTFKDLSMEECTVIKFPIIPIKFKGTKYWLEKVKVTYKRNIIERLDYHGDCVTTKGWSIIKVERFV